MADDRSFDDLQRYGEVLETQPPRAKLRISRGEVAKMLAAILAQYAIEDVVVEDPPLEEVIAEVFSQVDAPFSETGGVSRETELLSQ
jgi:ABC-2 type transport system ATP-binding protein